MKATWSVLLCGVLGVTAWAAASRAAKPNQIPIQYTAFTKEELESKPVDHGKWVVVTRVMAFRSDGSQVHVENWRNEKGGPVELRTVTDVPGRRIVRVYNETRSLVTLPLTPKRVEALSKSKGSCDNAQAVHRKILGYDAFLFERQFGTGRKQISWLAPALGCIPLEQTLFEQDPDGNEVVMDSRHTARILIGEPKAALFDIPSGYVERSPSQALAEYRKLYPEMKEVNPEDELVKRTEENYTKGRSLLQQP